MPRFIVLFAFGALLVACSQVALSLGIHPDHLASLRYILQSGAGLVVGVALAATGLLGLAEGYQQAARRIGPLLQCKALDEELNLAVRSENQLQTQNRHFWRAYRSAGLSLALFLGGLFAISFLLGKSSFFHYMAGLSAGIAILGIMGALWGIQGLRSARQCHKSAKNDADLLDAQPDHSEEEPIRPTAAPSRIRWSASRKQTTSYARSLARQRQVSNR